MLETDGELVKRRVKEESLNHRLAVYIENFVKRSCAYSYLSVDIEYNKNYSQEKAIEGPDGDKQFIRPDILVHERNTNFNNKIAIECKLDYMNNHTKRKLTELKKKPYSYEHCIGIVYKPEMSYLFVYIATEVEVTKHVISKSDFMKT